MTFKLVFQNRQHSGRRTRGRCCRGRHHSAQDDALGDDAVEDEIPQRCRPLTCPFSIVHHHMTYGLLSGMLSPTVSHFFSCRVLAFVCTFFLSLSPTGPHFFLVLYSLSFVLRFFLSCTRKFVPLTLVTIQAKRFLSGIEIGVHVRSLALCCRSS